MLIMNNIHITHSEPIQFNNKRIRGSTSHVLPLPDTMYALIVFVPPGAQWKGNFNGIEGVCNRMKGRA